MGTPPAIATRREVRSDELDLAALGLWLCRTIECAGRIPQNHLRALCDAVLAMVQSYVAESGGADRVAVEVERDGGCVALRVLGYQGASAARSDVLVWSA